MSGAGVSGTKQIWEALSLASTLAAQGPLCLGLFNFGIDRGMLT